MLTLFKQYKYLVFCGLWHYCIGIVILAHLVYAEYKARNDSREFRCALLTRQKIHMKSESAEKLFYITEQYHRRLCKLLLRRVYVTPSDRFGSPSQS